MVMHARTHPRLHDGYHDRNRAHPYQTVGKNPSKSQSGNYNELRSDRRKESPSVRQTDSPSSRHSRSNSGSPRIGSQTSSKSSYSQRTKQRGSSISPSENSTNHQSNAGSNSHSSSDRHSNHDRNISETLDKLNKACAEWSDHISSSGKKYFYNFRTEVSQWEKPKEWAQRDILLKELQKLKERKDCISSSSSSSRPKTLHTISSSSSGSRSKGIESKHSSSDANRPVQHQTQSSSRHSTYDRPSQHKPVLSALQRTSDTTQQTSNRQHEHKNSRSSNTPTTTETTKSLHRHNIESPLVQDMSSPTTPQSTSSRHSQHHHHPLKSPLLHRQSSKSPIVVNSNQQGPRTDELSYNGQSLQQKLQQVEKNITSATNQASPMSLASAASDLSSPQFSPHSTHVSTPSLSNKQQLHEEKSSDSPNSHKSREASPARSIGSHTSGVCHSNLPSAPQLPSSVSLTSSLVQHYNETLTNHVLGWPAEHLERQAQRFNEEAHIIGSQNSSQISVDLKFARSLVRVSEIQSTLQEQRILFLQQQIHELERLKNESTSNT
ncbi:WW domain-containing adapter protein with coiled-coil-like [Saccoglossus kowalevskii]|uniref:WW domain-containing adapter protein with coiled-coil-like n=1 Tax=Saccoglossus kowalevskii TaxID=10224 RepID=A0ABM0LYQ8_SACKO|nr:PREDICTED: WW domain-containing adapter protein with coiled-coil-like [Saccoglossus kowalevskii]